MKNEVLKLSGGDGGRKSISSKDLHEIHRTFGERMNFSEAFLAEYKGLVFQLRAEGVSLSDRRAIKLLKLFSASALLDGRATPHAGDFFILRHIWNNLDQADILDGIVGPVVEAFYRDNPEQRRSGAAEVGMEALVEEINRIRDLLTGERVLSDIQLFSQLKALNEIKAALQAVDTSPAKEALARVDQLLGHVFQSGKFA